MTRRAPEAPARAPARATARRDDSEPSVPTTTVRYALFRSLTVPEPTEDQLPRCAGGHGAWHARPGTCWPGGVRVRLDGRVTGPSGATEEDQISSATPPALEPVRVEVDGLTKTFGTVRAVDDLSFTVEPGQVTAFLGPNDAGKTTTLRMALGLITPDRGTTSFNGVPYAALPEPTRQVGAVLETAFHPGRTGRNHLRVYCRAAGLPVSRADEVLDQVGLGTAGNRKAGGYSLGMRQRLGLATALLGDPGVMVLDEPANGLDPEGIQWLRGFLRPLAHDQGRTVLVSSHLLAEVEQTADRVVIVGAGRLVREGSIDELRAGADGAGAVLVRSPEAARLAQVLRAAGSTVTEADGALTVAGRTAAEIGHAAFAAGVELHELRPHRSGLEEIYFALTAGTEQFAAHEPGTPVGSQEGAR